MKSPLLRYSLLATATIAIAAGLWVSNKEDTPLLQTAARKETKPTPQASLPAPQFAPVSEPAPTVLQTDSVTSVGSAWNAEGASPLQVFTEWAGRYIKAPQDQKAALLSEGIRLAEARREVLSGVIRDNPEGALAAAVPVMVRKQLPKEIQSLLEERVSGQGELTLLAATPFEGGNAAMVTPLERRALVNNKEYRAHTYGRRSQINSIESASIIGVAIDKDLAVSDSPVRLLEAGETADGRPVNEVCVISGISTPVVSEAPLNTAEQVAVEAGGRVDVLCSPAHVTEYADRLSAAERATSGDTTAANGLPGSSGVVGKPAQAWTHGTKKVLIIRVDFSDKVGTPVDYHSTSTITDDFAVNVFNIATGVKPFFEECSYGKTSLLISGTTSGDSPDVTEVLRMPLPSTDYTTDDKSSLLHSQARTLAEGTGLNLANYDRIGVVFTSLPGFTWAGLAGVQSKNFWINGDYTFRVVAHEVGHNYGLNHSSLWQVADGDPVSPAGTNIEYGDIFDSMGSGTTIANHFSHWNKSILQWIPDTSVPTITSGGIYRVYRFDHKEANTTNNLALKVVRNRDQDYWIGYRRATDNASLDGGAYILWGYNTNQYGRLLDMTTPGTSVTDAGLAVGATFIDTVAGITLQPVTQGGSGADEWLDVQVTLQPRVSWTQSEYVVNEQGGSAVLTLNRAYNSSGAVSVTYTTSNDTATEPADYTATTNTVTWANGDMAPKTITIPVVADALVEGAEKFNVTLSGVTGGVLVDNPVAVVTLADPGSRDTTFRADFVDSTVRKALPLPDGNILAVGHFKVTQNRATTAILTRRNVALFSSTGVIDPLFAAEGGTDNDMGNYNLSVRDAVRQPDGKFVLVGFFNSMHGVARGNIARLNSDGSLDSSFAAGAGANGPIYAVLPLPNGQFIIGGAFTSYNGSAKNYIARLNADGSFDPSFGGPAFGGGSGWRVECLALQPDGKILVGGTFYVPTSVFRSGLARLTADGAYDPAFSGLLEGAYGSATNSLRSVLSIMVQADGSIFVGGNFLNFNNGARNGFAKLTSTGALDTTYTTSTAYTIVTDPVTIPDVRTILTQPDNRLIIGGLFTTLGGVTTSNLGRVGSTGAGTVDTAFSSAGGPDSSVDSAAMQADGRVIFSGSLSNYQSSTHTAGIWRFFAGLPGLPGIVQMNSEVAAGVEGTSATLSVTRTGGTAGTLNVGYSTVIGTAGTSDFTTTSGNLTWADGDGASKTITVPVTSDALADSGEVFAVNLGQAKVGSVVLGALQTTQVTVGTAFDSWRTSNFTSVEQASSSLSGDLADIEFDGIINLHEFAFNLSPKTSDVAGLPYLGKTNVSGSDYLTITFIRRKPALDLTYTPQVNDSLPGSWQSTAVQVDTATDNLNGTETVTYRDTVPVGQVGSPTRFMRVKVDRSQ